MEDVDLGLKLLAYCRNHIKEQAITCPETVYQSDRVVESSYAFVEGVCDIVGYAQSADDDED